MLTFNAQPQAPASVNAQPQAPASDGWIERTIGPPTECPDDWVTESYRFGPHAIRLTRPRDPDGLLNDPAVQHESRRRDYMPYWAFVWPGALLLAEHIVARPWPAGTRAVEIGCGLGLAGLAALAVGLDVTFTDYSPAALALAEHNARLNGFEQFATRVIDWQNPPHDHFDVVLGADVLYESRCLPDVLRVLDAMLAPDGIAMLSDPNRSVADPFADESQRRAYSVQCTPACAQPESARPLTGRIFSVRHDARSSRAANTTPTAGPFMR